MQKFTVHVYPQVRIKVTNVQARDVQDAALIASELKFHDVLNRTGLNYPLNNGMVAQDVEYQEDGAQIFLVDKIDGHGNVVVEESVWTDAQGDLLVDGLTKEELKAKRLDLVDRFMNELLDSVESLGQIADVHGQQTLVDLMYLQHAILTDGHIDVFDENSKAADIVLALPSGSCWEAYLRFEDPRPAAAPRTC